MTVNERLHIANMRYADQLVEEERFCDAVSYYEQAQVTGGLDAQAQEGYERALLECFPPTPTIDLTLSVTPQITVETPVVTTVSPPTVAVTTEVVPTTAVPTTEVPTTAAPPTETPTTPGP